MSRRQWIVITGGGVVLVLATFLWMQRRSIAAGETPAWLHINQPPDSIAPDLLVLSEEESMLANRAAPMAAACTGPSRVRRTYPGDLASSPHSFIRAGFALGGGI